MIDRRPGRDDQKADATILHRRVDLLYEGLPVSLFAVVGGAGLALWLISGGTPTWLQWGWFLVLSGLSLLRILGYVHFHLWAGAQAQDSLRLRWALVGALASALAWGGASAILFIPGDHSGQAVLAFVIAGISAGAVTTLSVFAWLSVAVTVLVLGPLILRLLLSETELGPGVALMCLLFALLLVVTTHRFNRIILDGLRMCFAREQAEAHMERQAFFDPLTELPNRRLLMEHLRQDLAQAHRQGQMGAVAFIDLDRFKTINDSLGHQVGDRLLRETAARLADELAEGDTAARLGGDEFVALLTNLSKDPVEAAHLARQATEQIRVALSAPYRIAHHDLHVSASIGIALYPTDGSDPDALLRAADTAMYRAKDAGRNAIRFFLPEMQAAAVARMEMEKALRGALEDNELRLFFQPQLDRAGRIVGAEALARWPRAGIISAAPDEFVPLAEESGLVYAFGDWVLERACADMGRIRAAAGGERIQRLAVNISPRQFRRREFAEHLESLMHHHGVIPADIELELTERTLVEDVDDTKAKMERLRRLGVSFSIDDFGTGYSSLAYLKRLPVDSLKIDRSFVRDLVSDPSDAAIAIAIIDLGRHLGLKVIAEGVDCPEVHQFLLDHACDGFQGYLFHRPMPLDDFLALIGRQTD